MIANQELKVSLYSGVLYHKDAISNSVRAKVDVLRALRESGTAIDYRVFTHATDYDDSKVHVVSSAAKIILTPWFHDCHLHILEFGIHYSAFDIMMVPTRGRKLVIYHNVTPLRLAATDDARAAIEKSLHQLNNISQADRILCDSEFNRDNLRELGLGDRPSDILPLFPSIDIRWESRMIATVPASNPVQLLFVGRMVESKGILDLIAALGVLKSGGESGVRLDIVGAVRFSDRRHLLAAQAAISRLGLQDFVKIVGELADDDLAASYRTTDIFVMPSYHEGFCVPLLEAMASGCFPIVSDAGNLPRLLNGLGRIVRAGDHVALAAALREAIFSFRKAREAQSQAHLATERGTMTEEAWRTALCSHVAEYSRTHYEAAIRRLLQDEARVLSDLQH